MISMTKVADLNPGDMLDLEGDEYADPGRTNAYLRSEYLEVWVIDPETPTYTVLYGDNFSCGFPPDHKVKRVVD